MPSLDYLRYDVFTDTAFTGNPLAVVIDPPPLTATQMQTVAGEFNLSETVFVRTSDNPVDATSRFDVRIFTPTTELPFAGHPTVGAAIAVVDHGLAGPIADGPGTDLVFREGVGDVAVRIVERDATLTTPAVPQPVEIGDPVDVVRALGLEMDDLHPHAGPSGWSAGVPFTIVTLRDLDSLARASIDRASWARDLQFSAAPEIYALCPLDGLDGRSWRARMFAPGLGLGEDPATGSAAAATAGYLAGRVSPARADDGWEIRQGIEMGRPSTMVVGLVRSGREVTGVTVGGTAVQVGSGTLRVPSHPGEVSPAGDRATPGVAR